jgi:outer membrane lipoprotein SlyB
MGFMRTRAWRLRATAGLVATALWCLAAVAHAQSIKIPDFREPPRTTLKPGETCDGCGTIRSIREAQAQRPVSVPKVFQNEPMNQGPGSTVIVGAVVALPLGEGKDKPFVGGVGTPEMRERFTETTYEVVVQLDNGSYTTVQRADGAMFRVGDRVRVHGIELELLAP